MSHKTFTYGEAIREGFRYLLAEHPEVFAIGQGLWSPWYVGSSMTDLEKEFGKARVIDSPISELACTGAAVGASLCGYRPIVIHPRMDFMLLATDQLVNQAAKWSYMFAGQAHPKVTIRGIVNRGGEQGAQHSQALHSMFAHIPGLRVVMPATVADARDLLIASVLCDDPVLYIDDRWLYEQTAALPAVKELCLSDVQPQKLVKGEAFTLVASSFSTQLCLDALTLLRKDNITGDLIDLRVINPLNVDAIVESVRQTGRLCVVDGSWANCGLAGEIIASVVERVEPSTLKTKPVRITLPDAPAPTSKSLEAVYYPKATQVAQQIVALVRSEVCEASV
ncbi:MAG: pyruvate dehydrogenase [Legionellaceae bacterium]|nr:pyruvate dehydrogenase [Legionellaceae bacterium]